MSCCPEGALGQLGTEGYVCKVSQGCNILYLYTRLALKGESRESGGLGPVLCWLGLEVHHLELRHLRVRLRQDEVNEDSVDGASLMCHVYLYCTHYKQT